MVGHVITTCTCTCIHTAMVMVSVRIRVSVRKLGFITRLAVCSYFTIIHTVSHVYSIVHDNCLMLFISAEMTSDFCD